MSREDFERVLADVLSVVSKMDPNDAETASKLAAELPVDGPQLTELAKLVRQGVEERWLAEREGGGIRYSRVKKAREPGELSVDCVNMAMPGPGHTHPNGEIDLCFAVTGEPRFDGNPPGWTVYPAGSWHVPTVTGGEMDILYFLPGGAIQFGPEPKG